MAFFRWKCLPRCCCLFENCFELVFRMILHLICHFNPPFWPWSMGQVRVQGTLGKFSDDHLTSLFSSACFSSLVAFITSDNKFFSWPWEKRGTVKTRFHVLFKATEVSSVYSLSNLWTGPLIPPTLLNLESNVPRWPQNRLKPEAEAGHLLVTWIWSPFSWVKSWILDTYDNIDFSSEEVIRHVSDDMTSARATKRELSYENRFQEALNKSG